MFALSFHRHGSSLLSMLPLLTEAFCTLVLQLQALGVNAKTQLASLIVKLSVSTPFRHSSFAKMDNINDF